MKRLFVALSTLALLLVAAPASATNQAGGSCEPLNPPETWLELLTDSIGSQNWQGPLCLKACKAQLAGCKKVSTAIRKCKVAAAKAFWKADTPKCQLNGGEKKTCTDNFKTGLSAELDQFKSELLARKFSCQSRYEACKAACAP